MANLNNFDQSSSGIDLDLTIFRDEEQGRENFKETFKTALNPPHKKFDFYAISVIDEGEFDFTDPNQYRFTRSDLNSAIKREKGLIEDLKNYLGGSPLTSRYTKGDLVAALREVMPLSDLAYFMSSNFKCLFEMIACYGYSQGDYACIVYSRKDVEYLATVDGTPWHVLQWQRQQELSNLIFNQPVWGSFKIVAGKYECEYMIDQLMADPYEYNKDQILAAYVQQGEEAEHVAAEAYKFLAANLPDFI